MNNDFIHNDFFTNIDRDIIKKNIRLVRLVFMLTFAYAICSIYYWFPYWFSKEPSLVGYYRFLFFHRIFPVVNLFHLGITCVGYYFILKANEYAMAAIENEDSKSFNLGFKYFYQSSKLGLISLILSLFSIIVSIKMR